MALVKLSVVEQRYRAVLAVLAGESVVDVAAAYKVSRQSVHTWLTRYRAEGLGGLADRSHRPASCSHRSAVQVETAVCELRREHPRWGPRRLVHELQRAGKVTPVPSRTTVHRILVRHGLIIPTPRRRPRESYKRWQRAAPMQLWQLDIVGGVVIDDGAGGTTEAKLVTGVDDCSRFCVIATVVARATGRAVCLAFVEALRRYGIPDEVLTDNGKQFTARFGRNGGEVLFDRICRDNAITHRLTQPSSPTTTGKIERFHGSLRREFLDHTGPFTSIEAAQAAVDTWVTSYNVDRPHQGLDMGYPADQFAPSQTERADAEALLPLRVPALLRPDLHAAELPDPAPVELVAAVEMVPDKSIDVVSVREDADAAPLPIFYRDGPVEFERVVPASGNLGICGKQFWLGPIRAGQTITFWADHQVIHLLVAGVRIKTVRSHLSSADLARLATTGGRPAGTSPLPPAEPGGTALEVDRTLSRTGLVSLGPHRVLVADVLGGRRVTVRIDQATLMVFDPETRELLRTRPNPLTYAQARTLRGARPAGPPPRPRVEPVTVQRRVSATGVIMVAGQVVSVGRSHGGTVVTVHVAEHTLTIDLAEGGQRTIGRTTDKPIRSWKALRPRKNTHVS